MNEMKPVSANRSIAKWEWRDTKGQFHKLATMETRHLFYTLRMIWNHTMPESVKLRPYQHYCFSPFYTAEYMQQAILHIGRELLQRSDLRPSWQADLAHMEKHFADSPKAALGVDLFQSLSVHNYPSGAEHRQYAAG